MEKEHTATFIGHKDCTAVSLVEIKEKVRELICNGVTEFMNGGMGAFDWLSAKAVYDLKNEFPEIRNYLVIPYLTFNVLEKKYFDAIIYPEGFEKYHFKAAIPARNRYMIQYSAYAICYVTHSWGGAAQTMDLATKNGLTIINLRA